MQRVAELRQRYPVFRYERFEVARTPTGVNARFRFTIPPDISFTPEVQIDSFREGWGLVGDEFLHNAVFHLGLIEAFSYWKSTASPVIEVHAGSLDEAQVSWWEDLLFHGMGEYFYRNDIDFTAKDFVKIVPAESTLAAKPFQDPLPARTLLTIGGGRDSALAAGLLRDSKMSFACMLLNPSSAARRLAAQVSAAAPVLIRREISPQLLELNRQGYLNGHTPFSAYLAFLSAVAQLLYGYAYVIVSNERSSGEANVHYRGTDINHQYSKTLRFETRFDEYLQQYLVSSCRYFSFVRPLYELQIGKLFANFPEFFSVFKSCNRNRSDSWCCQCPKCVSVFVTMYPFVPLAALIQIFGQDLFQRKETIPILRSMAGLDAKPFECVATTKEIIAALSLCVAKLAAVGDPLPPVVDYAVQQIPGAGDMAGVGEIMDSYGPHRMPAEFESILTKALNESPRSL